MRKGALWKTSLGLSCEINSQLKSLIRRLALTQRPDSNTKGWLSVLPYGLRQELSKKRSLTGSDFQANGPNQIPKSFPQEPQGQNLWPTHHLRQLIYDLCPSVKRLDDTRKLLKGKKKKCRTDDINKIHCFVTLA